MNNKIYFSFFKKIIFTFHFFLYPLDIYSQNIKLTIQPDGTCGKDALIGDCIPCGYPNSNFGDFLECNALAWTNSGGISNQRSLIQFDFSSIPTGTIVQSAILTLYFDPTSSNASGLHSKLSGPNNAYLQEITTPWDEHSVTWNNQPSTSTNNQSYLGESTIGTENYTIDITSMVQDFVNNPGQNFGMMLKLVTESYYRCLLFASSDYPDASLRPKVDVTYSRNDTGCFNLQYDACNGIDALIANCVPCGFYNSNFGDFPEFNALAWTNGGSNSDHRSLIYWDLHDIPVNATIQSAYLNLYFSYSSINASGYHSSLSGPNDAYIQKVINSWGEYTVTWANQPSTTTLNEVYLPMSTSQTQDYTNIDVTNLIQEMVSDPINNYGLMMKLNDETEYRCLLFASSDNPDASKHPKLDICYSIPDNIIPESNKFLDPINIYPNPSNGNITISLNKLLNNSSLKIINAIGQELFNEQIKQLMLQKSINLIFPSGIYFIILNNSEIEYFQKIIIN